MNVRRGLWRLWVVTSALWILFVGVGGGAAVSAEFKRRAEERKLAELWRHDDTLVPVACSAARGREGPDYARLLLQSGNDEWCWYTVPAYQKLYPESAREPAESLTRRLYAAAGQPLQSEDPNAAAPWRMLLIVLAVAAGVPLAALALGIALFWAVSGFAVTKRV